MELKSHRNFVVTAHVCGWLILFTVPVLLAPGPGINQFINQPQMVYGFLLKNVLWMGVFYLNYFYVAPTILQQKMSGRYLIFIVLIIGVVSVIISWIDTFFVQEQLRPFNNFRPNQFPPLPPNMSMPPPQGFQGPPVNFPPHELLLFRRGPFFSNLLITVIIIAVSTIVVLWNDWQTSKEAEQERSLQKVAAELSVLKLQISPHFLFNTLNNIRWLIRSDSQLAEAAVLKLSHILRYILYQTNTVYVSLENELEHLKDYIALQKMRLTNSNAFTFELIGEANDKQVVPLLFLPVIENFFKYGDFESNFVNTIRIELLDSTIHFSVVNKILKSLQEESNAANRGIGIENLRKRLTLHYPNKHDLTIIYERNGTYFLNMIINLG